MSNTVAPRTVTVGDSAAAQSSVARTEAQIAADLERQRAELAATIDQLYERVQPAALAQEAKDEATARFTAIKKSASLALQDAVGGNTEALKKVGIVALSAVGALTVIVLLATRKPRRARRHARRIGSEAASQTLPALAAAGAALDADHQKPLIRPFPSPEHPVCARGTRISAPRPFVTPFTARLLTSVFPPLYEPERRTSSCAVRAKHGPR